jgi:predicted anti-sigma-YlaC factor YlaD
MVVAGGHIEVRASTGRTATPAGLVGEADTVRATLEGAEDLRHLGKCSAKRGWTFGAWLTCGACRVMG